MPSGNLSHTTQQFLYNTVSAADFGVANINSVKTLFLKGKGLYIPNTGDGASGKAQIVRTSHAAGVAKVTFVGFSFACPCDDCNGEYGIEIENFDQKPGVFKYYLPIRKFYGGRYDNAVACSGTLIEDALRREALIKTITLINADILGAGALVTASSSAIVTPAAAFGGTDDFAVTVKIYDANNVLVGTFSCTSTDPANLAAMIAAFNATSGLSTYGAFSVAGTAIGQTTKAKFVAASGYVAKIESVSGGNLTIDFDYGIVLTAKSADRQFNVKFTPGSATTVDLVKGVWEVLSPSDIAREFSLKPWQHGSQPNIPIKGQNYVKYTITAKMGNIADISAPNHREEFVRTIEIYVLSGQESTAVFDDALPTSDTNGTDWTLEQLFKEANAFAADVNW